MGSKIINLEIFLIYFFLLIPWPQTHVFKRLCSKDSSRLVRKIVRSKWTPILDKYQVKLPLECPFHPFREIFAPRQDAKKRDRPTQWTCRLCGKSFYQEQFLDLHFETRHKTVINEAEDAICLADYCDIMRCEVFQSEESSSLKLGDQTVVTDIEVWGDSLGQNSALAKANVAYLSLLPIRTSSTGASAAKVQNHQLCQDKIGQTKCQQTDSYKNSNENNYNYNGASRSKFPQAQSSAQSVTSSAAAHLHHSSLPSPSSSSFSSTSSKPYAQKLSAASGTKATTKQRSSTPTDPTLSDEDSNRSRNDQASHHDNDGDDDNDGTRDSSKGSTPASATDNNKTSSGQLTHMQKIRANCKTEELSKLKEKCEYLVRSCIGGLILLMTDQQFRDMEEEMNKAVCWYLTCERYWEDGPLEIRAFPWGLVFILILVLSTGVCFCYYIIWILFDSEETTINTTTNHHHLYIPNHQHYHAPHLQHQQQLQQQQQQQAMHEDHYLFQDYPTTGIHHGMTSVEPPTNTPYYYQQAQAQQQHPQQAELHHHQQSLPHDIYPEPVQYDYRHSPRRYIGDQRLPGTPTITMSAGGHLGGGQTPLRHPQTNLAYQQDILDRRDYISRPIATSVLAGGVNMHGPNSGSTGALSHHSAQMDCDNTLPATHLGSASMAGAGGVKHYNTIPRPLETRQRYVSGSQQSLRASSSSHEIIQNEVGHNEHYIYVTYPPDLKKRFFEKYE